MESLNNNEMFNEVSNKITAESKRVNDLRDKGEKVSSEDVESIDLGKFKEAFIDMPTEFLSDELLEKELNHLKMNIHKLKYHIPEDTKIILAAFPCGVDGLPFEDEEIKAGSYLTSIFVNEKIGLGSGYGTLQPSAHYKLLPKEIQEACAFKVNYDTEQGDPADEKDFEKFTAQFTKAFKALQKLLKS